VGSSVRELRTRTERGAARFYPLPDRVEGVIVDAGWACGLCNVSDMISPVAAVATAAKDD
jgi:hypothetical protein